jgi:tetratricopeptide (TPR) repeat protein
VTIGRGRARRLLALLAVTAPLLAAAPQKPGYTEETVPSEAAKRDYELCTAEGQTPAQAVERCQAALRHGLSGRVAAHVHILIGWAHWALGNPGPAADSWRAAAAFEPRDPSLRLGLGLLLEAAGRTAEAEAAFREAARAGLRADSDNLVNLVVGYGRGQLTWENFGHVLDRLAAGLASEGLAAEAHEALAAACDAYQKAPGKDAEALACRRQLIPQGKREAEGHLELARSLVDQGRDGLEEAVLSFREAIRLEPTLAPAHLGLAQAREKQNDPEGALASYREALRLDSSLSEARQAIAGLEALGFGRPTATPAAAGQPDTPEALAELRRCIDDGRGAACRRAIALGLSPLPAARAWTFLGMAIEAERGEEDVEDGARKAYREALRVQADYALAHYRIGLLDLYFRPRDAAAALEAALRLRPDWDAAREALAQCLAQERQWDKVAEIHGKVLESRPGDPRAARQLADALVNANRWAEAIPHLETVCRSPIATTNTWVTLGQALQKSSRADEARAAFLSALEAPGEEDNVDNQRIVRSWALNGLDGLGRTEDAIAARRRWLASDPDLRPDAIAKKVVAREAWSEARWYRSLHLELAAALDSLGRPAEAAQEREKLLVPYRNALAHAPGRADLHEALAEALAAAGRTEEAIVETRQAVRLEPAQAVWHRSLTLRLERAGRLDRALEAAETWRGLAPASAEAALKKADILLQLGRDSEAFDLLQRSSEGAKHSAAFAGMLVSALESRGRAEEALPWWRRWFEAGPGWSLPAGVTVWTRESEAAAAESYRRAALRDHDDPVPECALGFRLWRQGSKSDEAIEAYRRCAAKGPRLAWAQAEVGLRLSGLGRHKEAAEALEAAEKIEPGFLKARSAEYRMALETSQARLKEASGP